MSCSNPTDKAILIGSVLEDIPEIRKELGESDTMQIDYLDFLEATSTGRIGLVSYMEGTMPEYYDIVVQEPEFSSARENMFNYYQQNNVTYAQMFVALDSARANTDRLKVKLNSTFEKLDSACLEIQNSRRTRYDGFKLKSDSLNDLVGIELISVRKTEVDYTDYVQVRIKMTNNTSQKVEAILFTMILTDKLGSEIAELRCSSNDAFQTEDVGSWAYSRWERSEVYDALKNMSAEHLSSDVEILKLNLNGELIDISEEYMSIPEDEDYKTPNKLNGSCPYIDQDHPLIKELNGIQSEASAGISRIPLYKVYTEQSLKFLDVRGALRKSLNPN